MNRTLGVLGSLVMFKTSELVILAVSAVTAFALLFWLFDAGLVYSLVMTLAFSALALGGMYFRSRRSS